MFEELEIIPNNNNSNNNIPNGTYYAELIDVRTKEKDTKFGKKNATTLFFKILTEPFSGNILGRTFFWDNVITEKSTLGKILKDISNGNKFVVKENIGKKVYLRVINVNINGKIVSRIESIIPDMNQTKTQINQPENLSATNNNTPQPTSNQQDNKQTSKSISLEDLDISI